VVRLREMSSGYRILVGKFQEKKSLERRRHKWEDRLRTYLVKLLAGFIWLSIVP
jgi:hypothetical protein